MPISENAQKLLEKRYFLRDSEGELIENTWLDLVDRVVENVIQAEKEEDREEWRTQFTYHMDNLDFIPSSPTLFNAGTPSQQLSSCFIVSIEDNIEGIFSTVAECAKIFQMSGGAGFSMKNIRPNGAECKSSGSSASGVVSFMYIFDTVVERVKQGNKRNGALLIALPDNHPEILDFIMCKNTQGVLTNMNISVSVSNELLEAVEKDIDWDLVFGGKVYKTIKAKYLWDMLMKQARKNGEPGICFQTNMDNGNMNPHLNTEILCNPCAEFVNIPYSSCNLASVNLSNIVNSNGHIQYLKLGDLLKYTMRFLDDMITVNRLPLKKIQEVTESIRPIGLGTMGFAHMLYKLEIPYNSDTCLKIIDDVYSFIQDITDMYNNDLAEERGVYPAWEGSEWEKRGERVRCSSTTSIAPNGSIAIIANTTGGIEPQFALVYSRIMNEGEVLFTVDSVFEEYLRRHGKYSEELLKKVADNSGSIQGLDEYFTKEEQAIFVVANDISPEWHVKVLARIQKYTSLSISKTVNLPKTATVEDVSNVFMMAGKSGIKGITVYVDGSRDSQVLVTSNTFTKKEEEYTPVKPRPAIADGYTVKMKSGCCDMNATVAFDQGKLLEVRVDNSNGGCSAMYKGIGIMTSEALRLGGDPKRIAEQLSQISCPANMKKSGCHGKSCPDTLGRLIKHAVKGRAEVEKFLNSKMAVNLEVKEVVKDNLANACPECGDPLLHTGGCVSCLNCHYTKC